MLDTDRGAFIAVSRAQSLEVQALERRSMATHHLWHCSVSSEFRPLVEPNHCCLQRRYALDMVGQAMAPDHFCDCSIFSNPQKYLQFQHGCLQRRHAFDRARQTTEFKHTPLRDPKTQIRLLMIWRTETDELHGHLHHFDLDDAPPYVAVSYMWGKGTEKTIILDGRPILILPNLFSFLHTFIEKNTLVKTGGRPQYRYPMWLWTDKLCINQASASEKNHQVPLMAQIYPRAKLVIVWLGTNRIDSGAFRAIKTALNWKTSGREWVTYTKDQRLAVEHLIDNGYWSRVWVVQEVKLAQLATLWCGLEELAQQAFSELNETKIGRGQDAYLVEFILDHQATSLAEVCMDITDRKCTDPRDRIYGVQSLFVDDERIQVDYEKRIELVFLEFAGKMIDKYSLETIRTGSFENQTTDAMDLLWLVGVAMNVFQKHEGLKDDEAYSCFCLLALYPERLDWPTYGPLIAKWLPDNSRCIILGISQLLNDIDGRAELLDELRSSGYYREMI